jgi:hypothetical protein
VGGGGVSFQKPKNTSKKSGKQVTENYQCSCAVNVVGPYEINPLKITKWAI